MPYRKGYPSPKERSETINKVLVDAGLAQSFTEAEFESLVDKASQPLESRQKPDAKEAGTSESPTSGDCNESHTH